MRARPREPPFRPQDSALAYTNRHGATYYLHRGKTKAGNVRYFVAKATGAGAIQEMPPGLEFTESINGVVSIRRTARTPSAIPAVDLELVRTELSRHTHLRYHAAEERQNEIVIYEPDNRLSADGVDSLAELCSGELVLLARRLTDIRAKTRYWPVMKFAASAFGLPHSYVAYRMSYRGEGGWLHLLTGPLSALVRSYVRYIGTDKFFELL